MVPVKPTAPELIWKVPWNPATETNWTSSPSRIHDTPRPTTTVQWNLVQGSRSIRAGTRLVTGVTVAFDVVVMCPPNTRQDAGTGTSTGVRERIYPSFLVDKLLEGLTVATLSDFSCNSAIG